MSSSSSIFNGDVFLPTLPPKAPKKRRLSSVAKAVKSRLLNRKVKSAEQLSNKNIEFEYGEERFAEADDKINKLISEKEQLSKTSLEYQLEIDNLRTLVHDVQEELCFLQSIKAENKMLKAELSNDVYKNVSEAQDEINYLSSQLEIYKDYKHKYENLRTRNSQLQEECDHINLSLKDIGWSNEQLQYEIESLKAKVNRFESHELLVSNAMADKEVLRERLQMREEKISSLVSCLEEQEMTIQDLGFQLQRMTDNVAAKEGAIGREIHSLKFSLHEKTSRIGDLEDKLHSSELLIRELENLRDHFRLSNCAFTENMQNYKKQFNMIVSISKKLLAEIDVYKAEMNKKNLEIQKLSVFPQSASSIVKFAQILNILKTSEDLMESDEPNAISFIPVMRRIVEQLKGEIIGETILYPVFETHNSDTQTEFLGTDKCIQIEPLFIEHKSVEVSLPDRHYFDHQKSLIKITELNKIVETLEESFQRVDSAKHLLEKKIISSVAEKSIKEKEICSLECQLRVANESLQMLGNEIMLKDSLLSQSLCEIELERRARESTSEILIATLDSNIYEYDMYIAVLETLLRYKEEKIQLLEDYLCSVNYCEETPDKEYITLLESEIQHLSVKYVNEKQNVQESKIQIAKLQAALSEKIDHFKIVQEKLLRAERIFEHLNNIENQCTLKYDIITDDSTAAIIPAAKIVTGWSEIDRQGPESHLKDKKDLKKKLLTGAVSKEYASNLIQRQIFQKRCFKKTINNLKSNISRIKCILLKLRKKLKLSESLNQNYSLHLSQLESYCTEVKKENYHIKEKLDVEKSKTTNLDISLQTKCLELHDLSEKKRKIEKILLKILKLSEKKASLLIVQKKSKETNTDSESFKNQENEVSRLKTEIKELTEKNNSLSEVIVNLENRVANILYIPQKENDPPQSFSVEVQTVLSGDDTTIKDIKNHYENVIKIFQKEKTMEKEEREKQNTINLCTIKEKYEEEISSIRKAHSKHLTKIEVIHKEEIENLKLFHQEQCKNLINRYELEEAHQKDIEKQKSHYETLLKSKETEEAELNNEIKKLKEEVSNIITQKQKDDSMFNDRIKEQLIEMKKKFKKLYKKLKKSHEAEIVELTNKHNNEIKQINMKNGHEDTKGREERQTSILEDFDTIEKTAVKEIQVNSENMGQSINDIICNKKIGINFKERIQCSIKEANGFIPKEILHILNRFRSGNPIFSSTSDLSLIDNTDSSINTPRLSEKYDLVVETADKMKTNFQDMLRNISSYHKHSADEKALIQEIKDLLNKERIHSCVVQQRLSFEFTRAEKLKAQKNELRKQLVELKKHLINVESDLHFEKQRYENLKKSFNSVTIQRRTSEQLETSMQRLRIKLENALQCEKRLSEELEEDKKTSERIQVVIESNKIADKTQVKAQEPLIVTEDQNKTNETTIHNCIEVTKDVEEKQETVEEIDSAPYMAVSLQKPLNNTDLKVVFIQRCGVLHTWREQFFPQSIEQKPYEVHT